MERWRDSWRRLVGIHLSTKGLLALREALVNDDPRLVQGHTTIPAAPGARRARDRTIYTPRGPRPKGCCAIGLAGWLGDGLATVGDVKDHFEEVCDESDFDMIQSGFAHRFVKWFDRVSREEMLRELLPEVERLLRMRLRGIAEKLRDDPNLVDSGRGLAFWIEVGERMYGGACGGPAGKGAKGKPRKRKAARRELATA